MKYKTFNYKENENCYFNVGNYKYNKQAMAITIVSKDGEEIVVTVNKRDYLYAPNTATLRNYSYTGGITNLLKKMGIIEEVYSKIQCNPYASRSETIDYCLINVDKLKEYTSEFNYKWELK